MEYITDFHEAELNAESVLRCWGFADAKATTGGADGGIDVRSKAALAQVKWKGGAAGRPEIQNLVGASGNDRHKQLFFFAASSFTKTAVEYANQVDVRLFIYDPLGKVEPANERALQFMKTLGSSARQPASKIPWTHYVVYLVAALLCFLAMTIPFIT
jgi:hypothetical protein